MSELAALKAELKAAAEQKEVLLLKAELAKLREENAALGAGPSEAAAPPPKKKAKKAKKAVSKEDAAALAALTAELEATRAANAALGDGAAAPAGAAPEKKKKKKEKKVADGAAAPAAAVSAGEVRHRAYVGGLPYASTKETINAYFADRCGPVKIVETRDFEDNPGKFCGVAFIEFGDAVTLERALKLDGTYHEEDDRCKLKCRRDKQKAKRPPPERVAGSLTVYAGNMSYDTLKEDVEAHFADNGCSVESVRFHTDELTGGFRGFCHVEFADEASLQAALKLAGEPFGGRALRVTHSETAKKRPRDDDAGGRGSGGRGRGRGGGKGKGRGGGGKGRKGGN